MNLVLLTLYTVLFGVLGFLLGTAGSIFSLFIPRLRQRVARYFERAAAATLHRPAITFGESSDLLLKRRTYDTEQGAEVIASGDDQLETANPDNAIWSFHGTPLSIVDEFFGVVIDQRHLHPGETLNEHIREGTLWVGDYWAWMNGTGKLAAPAFAPVPKQGGSATLQAVRALFWGGEEADHPDTVKTYVAKANEGRNDTAVWKQLLVPAVFLVVGFGLMWLAAKYGPSGGGGGQDARQVGGTLTLLLAIPDVRDRLNDARERVRAWVADRRSDDTADEADSDIEAGPTVLERVGPYVPSTWQVAIGLSAVAGLAIAGVVLLFLLAFFGPFGLFFVLGAFLVGFSIFPFSGPLLHKRLPTGVAERLGGVYLRLGILPYDNPDLELSTDGQRFVEGDGSGQRYRLAGKHIGFTINEDDIEDLFGDRAERASKVKARVPETDTGEVDGIPRGYAETDGLTFDRVKGYVPEDPDENNLYARLDRVMAPFQQANVGSRSKKALENAKEAYGAGWRELNLKQILYASLGAAVFGMGFGYVVFFGF